MKDQVWISGEIEVEMWGCFTTHHRMLTETDVLGELTLPAFSSGGVFEATDGRELVVEKTSWWRGWHELRENDMGVFHLSRSLVRSRRFIAATAR